MGRELRDLYDKDGKLTGKTYFKGDKNFPDGCYPMVVAILIENSKGEFLMQLRSKRKGGYLAVTGGHPKSGETPLQGILSECREEMGLDFSNENLTCFCEEFDGSERFCFYYLKTDIDITKCKLQKEEVESLVWISSHKIFEMTKSKQLHENQTMFFNRYLKYLNNKNSL